MMGDRNLMETPAAVMGIRSKAIEDFAMPGKNKVMDILTLDPSIRRTTSADTISVRGVYTPVSKMNVNGIPGMYSTFSQGSNFLSAADVLSGPSLIYNGSTTQNVEGGTVNFKSKKAGKDPLTAVGVQFSGKNHMEETVDFSRRLGPTGDWGIRLNALTSDGEMATHDEKLRQRNIFVNLDHQASDNKTNLLIGYAYSKQNGGNSIFQTVASSDRNPLASVPFLPSAPDGKYNLNPGWAYKESKTWLMTLNHEQKLGDHWTAFLNAGIMKNDTPINMSGSSGSKPGSYMLQFNPDGTFNGTFKWDYKISASQKTTRYIGTGLKSNYDWGFMKNELLFAVDRNAVTSKSASSKTIGTYIGNMYGYNDWDAPTWSRPEARLSSKTVVEGFTMMDTMKFLDDRLVVNAGLHHHSYEGRSYNRTTGQVTDTEKYNRTIPSYGIVYRITPELSVYAAHTETFLAGEEADSGSDVDYANEGELLDPAVTKSNEAGVKLRRGSLLHTLAFYEIKRPETIRTADNYCKYGGETKFKGIEWSTAGSIGEKWDFIASVGFNRYIWVKNSDPALNGRTANGIPKWNSNLAVTYKPNDKVSVLGRMSYIGKANIAYGAYTVPSYLRFDAGVKVDTVWNGTPVTLSAMCYNLTNKKGWFTADQGNQLLAADPRTFVLSANFKL